MQKLVFRLFMVIGLTALCSLCIGVLSTHLFYQKKILEMASYFEIIRSADAPMEAASPSVTSISQLWDPTTGRTGDWKFTVSFQKPGVSIVDRIARVKIDIAKDPRHKEGFIDLRGKQIATKLYIEGLRGRDKRHYNYVQFELYDTDGRVLRGPSYPIINYAMQYVEISVYTDVPIPLGWRQIGFDPARVRYIGFRFKANAFADKSEPSFYPASGSIILTQLYVTHNSLAIAPPDENTTLFSWPKKKTPYIPLQMTKKKFFLGINYPWNHYGWDFGRMPAVWAGGNIDAHDGWSKNRKKLADDLRVLKKYCIDVVRLFVFCDFRTGLAFDENRRLAGFDPYVVKDMQAVLEIFREEGMQVILVIFDHSIADYDPTEGTGEYSELITNLDEQDMFLAKALDPLLDLMADYQDVIFAVDLMNEPEHALFLINRNNFGKLQSFLGRVADLIHTKLPNTLVTVGSANRQHLSEFWQKFPADILQFHFYKAMEDEELMPFNASAARVATDRPVFIGEAPGDIVPLRILQAKQNGYAGILFWAYNAGDHYTVNLEDILKGYLAIMDTEAQLDKRNRQLNIE